MGHLFRAPKGIHFRDAGVTGFSRVQKVEQNMTQKPVLDPTIHWTAFPASSLTISSTHANHWDALNASRGDIPVLSSLAVITALKTLGNGTERLFIGDVNGDVVAMLVLVRSGTFKWTSFQPSQLPLGAWVARSSLALTGIARSLLSGPLGPSLVLSITQIDSMLAQREPDAEDIQHDDYIDTAWVDIAGSFADYWAARGKNLRQNMRKQRSKLASEGIQVSMTVVRDHAEIRSAIEQYGLLESSGWKGKEGTAVRQDNAQGHFYRELLELASKTGQARVYQYRFNEKIVAMNLCLLRSGTLAVLKTAYDESIQYYSPAFLLREDEMQSFHEDPLIDRIEYLGRLMDWHTKFTHEKRPLYHLTTYRWPFVKTLANRWRQKTVEADSLVRTEAESKTDSKMLA
jgi:CelD/BcsL family acetyltransferase involved in cellulose biosynthesis